MATAKKKAPTKPAARKPAAKKAPARKAPAKKPVAKKAPAKKAAVRKVAVKKAVAKKAASSAPTKPLAKVAARKSRVNVVPSRLIDARIESLGDWRGEMLARLRDLIHAADPDVVEDWKWEVPVWSHDGLICTGETYKKAVKLTFARGAALPDAAGLFNSSLGGGTRRAIDFHEGATIHEDALMALVRAAVALNQL